MTFRRDGFLLAMATGVVGVTFGVVAETAGFTMWQSIAMSALVFTGASQFAAVGVIDGGGTPLAAVGSALLLALRNTFYGPVMAPHVTGSIQKKLLAAQLIIDETTGMALAQDQEQDRVRAFYFTGIWLYLFWNAGTIGGVVLGDLLGDPAVYGLDVAFPAAFVALLWPHLRTRPGQVSALVGASLAVVGIPLLPAGGPLLLAAMAVAPAYVTLKRSAT